MINGECGEDAHAEINRRLDVLERLEAGRTDELVELDKKLDKMGDKMNDLAIVVATLNGKLIGAASLAAVIATFIAAAIKRWVG